MSNNITATARTEFNELLQLILQTRQKVFVQANTALIELYWLIGKTISHKVQSDAWGKGVVAELAAYIAQNAPEVKGFGDKNLWRMKQFYETYAEDEKLAAVRRELSWNDHRTFSPLKRLETRVFDQNLKTLTTGESIATKRNKSKKPSALLRESQQGES
jgi:hypothetical protein